MSRVWYGSINNRLEENRMFVSEIKVGTGVTEYLWSDRHPYEVTEVTDQKHVRIRRMKHSPAGEEYSNDWKIESDENASDFPIMKRGKYWYKVASCTPEEAKEILESDDVDSKIWLCHNGFDAQEIIASGKTKRKYHRMNLSFGRAEYYYDYSF